MNFIVISSLLVCGPKCNGHVELLHVSYFERKWDFFNRGADKSLARPGRKQATVTKL